MSERREGSRTATACLKMRGNMESSDSCCFALGPLGSFMFSSLEPTCDLFDPSGTANVYVHVTRDPVLRGFTLRWHVTSRVAAQFT